MASTSTPTPPAVIQHSVAVHFLRLLTDYLGERGISVDDFLQRAGFNTQLLEEPNGRIPYSEFSRLCERARDQLNEPYLGLKLGQSVKPGHLGSWGFALMSCATIEEMMKQATRYSSLAIDAAHTVFEYSEGEYIRYRRSNLANGQPLGQLQDELSNSIWIALVRWLLNAKDLTPNWVSFIHERPESVSEYEKIFQCPIQFGATETAIAFRLTTNSYTLSNSNPQLNHIMDDMCAKLLKELGTTQEPSWLSIVRTTVLQSFKQGMPDLEDVAKATNMSEQELKKNLARRGMSFRGFVDDLRKGLAMGYVRDPNLNLVDIAFLLGFSEQSAFQRAFKRWTGMPPGHYRKSF